MAEPRRCCAAAEDCENQPITLCLPEQAWGNSSGGEPLARNSHRERSAFDLRGQTAAAASKIDAAAAGYARHHRNLKKAKQPTHALLWWYTYTVICLLYTSPSPRDS